MATGLDRIQMEFEVVSQTHGAFAQTHGDVAASYLAHLPWLFRLFRRVPFDDTLPLRARHGAAVVALYLAEAQDFLAPNAATTEEGRPQFNADSDQSASLIDDLFAAYFGLQSLLEIVKTPAALEPHWRSKGTSFDVMVGLSQNLEPLRERCPPKVLERVEALMRMPK